MKRIILVNLFLIIAFYVCGQGISDTIQINEYPGTIYYLHGKRLSHNKLANILRANPETNHDLDIARGCNEASAVLGGVGGFFVGFPLGAYLAGRKPDWTLSYIGGAFIVASVPLSLISAWHTKKAVKIYNHGLKRSGSVKYNYNFSLNYNGTGLIMKF